MFENMTLKEKVYQTFITYPYHISKEGTFEKFFEKHPCGGVYFAKHAVHDLAREMESGAIAPKDFVKNCRNASKNPLIVCADGCTIDDGCNPVSATAVAATRNMEFAYNAGKTIGMQMNYNHVDWVLGPCTDMSLSRTNSSISTTATDDAELNAAMYSAYVRGIQDQGVAATVKHFPGIGLYHVNFHYAPGKNTQSVEEWEATYGKSYRACFEAGCMCVMTSHLTFEAWSNKGDDGHFPIATFSSDITIKLLKEHLGFKGAVVSDALIMGGMACGNQIEDSVQAFKSGADFLLWPPMETADRIVEEIEKGNIPMSRLEDALSRIERVRNFLNYKGKEREYAPVEKSFPEKNYKEVVDSSIALIRNKAGLIPLNPNTHKKALIIGVGRDENEMNGIKNLDEELKSRGFETEFMEGLYSCWQDQVDAIQNKFDVVIVCYNIPLMSVDYCKICFSTTWSVHLLDRDKTIFVNFKDPYFADDYFPEAKTFINTNTSGANTTIAKAVAECLVGEREFLGKSPVKLNF
ncbi:MAG: hypothetical protein IKV98_08820 [Clostridia bacterium]|nr:hypothetical protein [Clostridia bacterium]